MSKLYASDPKVHFTFVGDDGLLLDERTGEYIGLNSTGAWMWTQLSSGRPIEAVSRDVSAKYGIAIDEAQHDVEAFLQGLLAERLLTEAGAD